MQTFSKKELTSGDLTFGNPQSEQVVVLIPGLGRDAESLSFLAQRLADKHGYYCCIFQHPSNKQTIDESVNFCRQKLDIYDFHHKPHVKKIHFVCASRGGLVARKMLKLFRPNNLGRAVCLGTPHKGSEMSNHFLSHYILAKLAYKKYGPSIHEMQTGPSGIERTFKDCTRLPAHLEWGMIAGVLPEDRKNERQTPLHPLKSPIPEPHDGTTSVESTKIEGLKDHIILHGTGHRELEVDYDTSRLCHQFLQAGKFKPLPENREPRILYRPPSPIPLHIRIIAFFIKPKA